MLIQVPIQFAADITAAANNQYHKNPDFCDQSPHYEQVSPRCYDRPVIVVCTRKLEVTAMRLRNAGHGDWQNILATLSLEILRAPLDFIGEIPGQQQ